MSHSNRKSVLEFKTIVEKSNFILFSYCLIVMIKGQGERKHLSGERDIEHWLQRGPDILYAIFVVVLFAIECAWCFAALGKKKWPKKRNKLFE